MGTKPHDWDPVHPKDRVCIFCYDPAPWYAVWRYGVNCVCYAGKCISYTNGMIGFEKKKGMLFRKKSEADRYFEIQEADRRAKETNKRAK